MGREYEQRISQTDDEMVKYIDKSLRENPDLSERGFIKQPDGRYISLRALSAQIIQREAEMQAVARERHLGKVYFG